ncbi:MAG: hypothetical protein SGJ09_07975, partial [Phycisphaerae bacterium]|nr:hypothetical protein [Phycisphaerae bacterium]
MPTPVNVIFIFAAALAAALLGVWHARRRAARRRGTGPLRSLVILRPCPEEWSADAIRGALTRLGTVPNTIDEREDPRTGASFVRVELVDGRRLLFIGVGSAYVADPAAIAAYAGNARVRAALSTHTAWSSIDLLGGCSD